MIIPIVLAGGSGTRLWPLSRAMRPKQFVNFFGDGSESLLGATLTRLRADAGYTAPIIMCNGDHRFLVREEVERVGIEPLKIIIEPFARNTAVAMAVAALYLEGSEPDAILAVLPTDQLIKDERRFSESVKQAAEFAVGGRLVLFGIKPTRSLTGHGYIRQGAPLDGCNGSAFEVSALFEKPEPTTAARFLESAEYHWNSGIFVMRVGTVLQELASFAPEVLEAAKAALAGAKDDLGFLRLDSRALANAPNVSIDCALMERTSAAAMVPLDSDWTDLGSWSALWEISPHDESGNAVCGTALLENTRNCYIHSEKALVATIGVHDLVIVDTPDALLIADKGQTEDVSRIVSRLRQSNRREHEQHLRNLRPWGYFEPLRDGNRFQVKLLHVKPGAKLSLQMHHHRSEHWTIVQGTAKVVVDEIEQLVRENESVYISATQWHRLENPGKAPLEVIEVQIGTYLGEDDIVRSDDVYCRSPEETH